MTGPDKQHVYVAGLRQNLGEEINIEFAGFVCIPAMDAGRQTKQRTAVRHVSEPESAGAVGVYRRATRKMRIADFDAAASHAMTRLRDPWRRSLAPGFRFLRADVLLEVLRPQLEQDEDRRGDED